MPNPWLAILLAGTRSPLTSIAFSAPPAAAAPTASKKSPPQSLLTAPAKLVSNVSHG
jgi:hypothetical protein